MAQRPKAKPNPKGRKSTEKSQAARFREAARTAEVDESGKAFERAFAKIIPQKRRS
jgi:hypothetical protein